jgi:pentatricopeptide repeat protein
VQNGDAVVVPHLFTQMQSFTRPNNTSFTILIAAYTKMGNLDKAKQMHKQIGVPKKLPVELVTSLINMYAACQSITDAVAIFEDLGKNGQLNDISIWNAMMSAYIQADRPANVFELYKRLAQYNNIQLQPDNITFTILLKACIHRTALVQGKQLHKQIGPLKLKLDIQLQTALLHMYAKCGDLETAESIFKEITQRYPSDLASWNAIILGYAQHGYGNIAVDLFDQMRAKGVTPDAVTFIALFVGCSHASLVEKALFYYDCMKSQYHITPTLIHKNCIVDVLIRANRLQEAEDFIRSFQPDSVTWRTLLGSCRVYKDLVRAERAAWKALEIGPINRVTPQKEYVTIGKKICSLFKEKLA